MRRLSSAIALVGLLGLTACMDAVGASKPTGTRDATVPMSSMAAFDPLRFAGRWNEVMTYLPAGASCVLGGVTFTPQRSGDMTITEGPCADGAPRRGLAKRVGPGRFEFMGETLWVLWVDQSYQTAVIATPEGRAHILSRSLRVPADKAQAAKDILAWNGFDVTTLAPARRK
ncbi:lipocalin family protein [Celeribacter sp.]|uniref:lipocalin family protein n=1 Tax=Celeribacter sp. TaxID=1890673 RepID=UPI003A8F33CE